MSILLRCLFLLLTHLGHIASAAIFTNRVAVGNGYCLDCSPDIPSNQAECGTAAAQLECLVPATCTKPTVEFGDSVLVPGGIRLCYSVLGCLHICTTTYFTSDRVDNTICCLEPQYVDGFYAGEIGRENEPKTKPTPTPTPTTTPSATSSTATPTPTEKVPCKLIDNAKKLLSLTANDATPDSWQQTKTFYTTILATLCIRISPIDCPALDTCGPYRKAVYPQQKLGCTIREDSGIPLPITDIEELVFKEMLENPTLVPRDVEVDDMNVNGAIIGVPLFLLSKFKWTGKFAKFAKVGTVVAALNAFKLLNSETYVTALLAQEEMQKSLRPALQKYFQNIARTRNYVSDGGEDVVDQLQTLFHCGIFGSLFNEVPSQQDIYSLQFGGKITGAVAEEAFSLWAGRMAVDEAAAAGLHWTQPNKRLRRLLPAANQTALTGFGLVSPKSALLADDPQNWLAAKDALPNSQRVEFSNATYPVSIFQNLGNDSFRFGLISQERPADYNDSIAHAMFQDIGGKYFTPIYGFPDDSGNRSYDKPIRLASPIISTVYPARLLWQSFDQWVNISDSPPAPGPSDRNLFHSKAQIYFVLDTPPPVRLDRLAIVDLVGGYVLPTTRYSDNSVFATLYKGRGIWGGNWGGGGVYGVAELDEHGNLYAYDSVEAAIGTTSALGPSLVLQTPSSVPWSATVAPAVTSVTVASDLVTAAPSITLSSEFTMVAPTQSFESPSSVYGGVASAIYHGLGG